MRINSRLNVRLPTVSGNGEWNETKLHRSKVTWRYFKAKSNEGKMMPTRGFFLLTLQQGLVMEIKLRIVDFALTAANFVFVFVFAF